MRLGGNRLSSQRYTPEFKDKAVRQILDRGCSVTEVSQRLGVSSRSLYKWVKAVKFEKTGQHAEESTKGKVLKQEILAAIPLSIVQIDTAGNVLYGNPAYHKILEYGDGELVGTSILGRAASEEERKSLSDFLAMVVKDQPSPKPYFITSRTKNGSTIDLQVDWNYERDSGGNLIAFTSVLTNITARKRAEKALQESRALLDSFFAVAPVAMALFDSEMRYLKLNEALADINGLSIEEHLHKRPSDVLPGPPRRFRLPCTALPWRPGPAAPCRPNALDPGPRSCLAVRWVWLHWLWPSVALGGSSTPVGPTPVDGATWPPTASPGSYRHRRLLKCCRFPAQHSRLSPAWRSPG